MRVTFVEISTATGCELLQSGAEDVGDLVLSIEIGGEIEMVVWAVRACLCQLPCHLEGT